MPKTLLLRRYWLVFGLLITLGLVRKLFLLPHGSAWQRYQWRPWHYAFMAGHAALFGLLVAATYLNQKRLWWVAILIISLKLYRLLKYYALSDYASSSNDYNHDYVSIFYYLQHSIPRWLLLPSGLLLSNNPVSAAFLTTLYVYWLVQCRKLLHAPGAAAE